ncbi:MAG: tRNA-binding protein [Candidatus Diapherotrites archaeon]
MKINYDDFRKVDIRVGTILEAEDFPEARNPAYKLKIDFGSEIGIKKSSAQATELYSKKELTGKQVLAVVNFPAKQIANFMSECLVLGADAEKGIALIQPDRKIENGKRMY